MYKYKSKRLHYHYLTMVMHPSIAPKNVNFLALRFFIFFTNYNDLIIICFSMKPSKKSYISELNTECTLYMYLVPNLSSIAEMIFPKHVKI